MVVTDFCPERLAKWVEACLNVLMSVVLGLLSLIGNALDFVVTESLREVVVIKATE